MRACRYKSALSRAVVSLVDHLAKLTEFDPVIVDSEMREEDIDRLQAQGVMITVAEKPARELLLAANERVSRPSWRPLAVNRHQLLTLSAERDSAWASTSQVAPCANATSFHDRLPGFYHSLCRA